MKSDPRERLVLLMIMKAWVSETSQPRRLLRQKKRKRHLQHWANPQARLSSQGKLRRISQAVAMVDFLARALADRELPSHKLLKAASLLLERKNLPEKRTIALEVSVLTPGAKPRAVRSLPAVVVTEAVEAEVEPRPQAMEVSSDREIQDQSEPDKN